MKMDGAPVNCMKKRFMLKDKLSFFFFKKCHVFSGLMVSFREIHE